MDCPVVHRASFDATKVMTSATSAGWPTRENTDNASAPARASEPFEVAAIRHRLAFFSDPFGNLIELAEVLP